ncbi:MAG: tetratricopeptide repeat protein [Bacteroidetes bacterium]|nr:tetratricopeptide repeat protein [Bacteroidota bacterium]
MKKLKLSLTLILLAHIGFTQNDSLYSEIRNFLSDEKYAEANTLIGQELKHAKSDHKAILLMFKSKIQALEKNEEEALNTLNLVIELDSIQDSNLVSAYFSRYSLYANLGKLEKALDDALWLARKEPENPNYSVNLTYLFGLLKDYKRCFEVCDSNIRKFPTEALFYNNFCYFLNQYGDYEYAIKMANKGLKHVVNLQHKGYLINNRGYANFKLGNDYKAIQDFNKALKIQPTNTYALMYRSTYYFKKGKTKKGCQDLVEAKSLGVKVDNLLESKCR